MTRVLSSQDLIDLFGVEGVEPPPETDTAPPPVFQIWKSKAIHAMSSEPWLCGDEDRPVLLAMALWVIFAAIKSGKTYWGFDLAFCIAFGILFNDLPTAHGNIAYLIAEGGAKRMHKRFVSLYEKYRNHPKMKQYKDADAAFDAGKFNMITTPVNLTDPSVPNGVDRLLSDMDVPNTKYVAVFLDTWALMLAAGGGHDTNPDTVMPSVAGCKRIQEATGGTVCIVSHIGLGDKAQDRPKGLVDLMAAGDGGTNAHKTVKNGAEVFTFTSMYQRHALNGFEIFATLVPLAGNFVLNFMDSDKAKKTRLTEDQQRALDILTDMGGKPTIEEWRDKCKDAGLFASRIERALKKDKNADKAAAWRSAWRDTKNALEKFVNYKDGFAVLRSTEKAKSDFDA